MAYFETAKKKLVAFVAGNEGREAVVYDTFGTRDVSRICDDMAHMENAIRIVARVAGATPEQIAEIES